MREGIRDTGDMLYWPYMAGIDAYVWDYNIDEAQFRSILAGELVLRRLDRDWAAVRLIEYAPYAEIVRLIGFPALAQVSFEVDSYHPSHLKDHIVNAFVADLQSCISNLNKPAVDASLQTNTDDVLGTLERLSTLRQQGMLTDEEFTAAKRKLLGL